jgi:hypothetical protein
MAVILQGGDFLFVALSITRQRKQTLAQDMENTLRL